MNSFSPRSPDLEPLAPALASSRKRLVLAGVTATALGITGLALGSQLADASNDAPDSATEPAEKPVDDVVVDKETKDSDQDRDDFIKFDTSKYDGSFKAFDTCMAEQLPEILDKQAINIFGDDAKFDELDKEFGDDAGSVTVHQPGEDGGKFGDLSFLDFGEGDGSITITKTDGQIRIATDGDVEEIDESDLMDLKQLDAGEFKDSTFEISDEKLAEFEEFEQQIEDASEACESTLPELGKDDPTKFDVDDSVEPNDSDDA
jgi:hypothetical protein